MAISVSRTRWGGISDSPIQSCGFFHTAQINGRWWLVDPDGGSFLSKGVNTVCFDQDRIRDTSRIPYAEACDRKYGSRAAWRSTVARRLRSWGFNSLGAWSDEAVAYAGSSPLALTPNLDLGATFSSGNPAGDPSPIFPDVFDPNFAAHARNRARDLCAPWRDDPVIIGWFMDNELCWGPDWRGPDELLTVFLNLPAASPGRRAAISFLNECYHQVDQFNAVWRMAAPSWENLSGSQCIIAPYARKAVYDRDEATERASNSADPKRAAFVTDCENFLGRLAQRYFDITQAAIKDTDPNHLVLGCRFAYIPQPVVIAAAATFADVISFNCYSFDPISAIDAYAATGKPCINTEFFIP